MQIGHRLRALREQHNLALSDIANILQVPAEQYCRYEDGGIDIPIALLHRLAAMFRLEVSQLLSNQPPQPTGLVITRAKQGKPIDAPTNTQAFALAHGYKDPAMQPLVRLIAPSLRAEPLTHPGQAFDFVLSGTVELIHGDQKQTLNVGDSVYFDASIPHARRAIGTTPAILLSVTS